MANADQIVQKIRDANLPPYVTKTTLPKEGWQALRDLIKDKRYLDSDSCYINYIVTPPPKTDKPSVQPGRAAALMGKELLLTGVPVLFTGLAGFLREVRLYSYETASTVSPILPVFDSLGLDYLVIGDFDNTLCHPSTAVWSEGMEVLLSHHYRGGGLILACDLPFNPDSSDYTKTFQANALTFTRVPVV